MKVLMFLLLMSSVSFGHEPEKPSRKAQEERTLEEKSPLALPESERSGDRTYSGPVDRIDEYKQEMEIDEERDRAEERAKEY